MAKVITGGCPCGGVRYEVRGPLRDVIACHCTQCRRTSGHFVAATACRRALFEPQGLKIVAHIFISEAGDYYRIDDDAPRSMRGEHGVALPSGEPP